MAIEDVVLGVSGSILRLLMMGDEGMKLGPAALLVAAATAAAVGLLGDGAFGGLVSESTCAAIELALSSVDGEPPRCV